MLKITLTGPESTGKTTLTKALAKHYNTVYVPEYARNYIATLNRKYTLNDIIHIAQQQAKLEDEWLPKANKILFCDTDMLVTKVWCDYVFGECPTYIKQAVNERHYDLSLLTYIDVPWVQDGLREHPNPRTRQTLFDTYYQALGLKKQVVMVLKGSHHTRMETAITAIDTLLLNK